MPAIGILVLALPVLASLIGLSRRSSAAAPWGWGVLVAQGALMIGLWSLTFLLPAVPVANGPIGSTCPASHGLVADLRAGVFVVLVLAGIGASFLNGRRGIVASIGTVVAADVLAVISFWLLAAPYLCDFS